MGALGLALAWFGYWVGFYGFDQLQGGNNSFLSLGVPGKFSLQPTDAQGGKPAAASNASTQLSQIQKSQQLANTPTIAGGTAPVGGTGVVATPGGITILYDAAGNPTCMDSKGNVVTCPAGTPTLVAK